MTPDYAIYENESLKNEEYRILQTTPYVFIKVIRAQNLPLSSSDSNFFVKVKAGDLRFFTTQWETLWHERTQFPFPSWNEVFVISTKQLIDQGVDDIKFMVMDQGTYGNHLIGLTIAKVADIPIRRVSEHHEQPIAHVLIDKRGETVNESQLLFQCWKGTEADDAFLQARQIDGVIVNGKSGTSVLSHVYSSPDIWYVKLNVIEGRGLVGNGKLSVWGELGERLQMTKHGKTALNANIQWNQELVFAVAKPCDMDLILRVRCETAPGKTKVVGECTISFEDVVRMSDSKTPVWCDLTRPRKPQQNTLTCGGLHLRVSLHREYHFLESDTHYTNHLTPVAGVPIGEVELTIIGAKNLIPMKNMDGKEFTDSYCVAKYGQQWVKTKTVLNSFNPQWNMQRLFVVFDTSTFITITVFDNSHLRRQGSSVESRMGKVMIPLYELASNHSYNNTYPLMVGAKRMGEIQLKVKFSQSIYQVKRMKMYFHSLLAEIQRDEPLHDNQMVDLRDQVIETISEKLCLVEPPLRKEVVEYTLEMPKDSSELATPVNRMYNVIRFKDRQASFLVFFLCLVPAIMVIFGWLKAFLLTLITLCMVRELMIRGKIKIPYFEKNMWKRLPPKKKGSSPMSKPKAL